MNYGSLFAGIGGIDLGLDRAGMHCEWQVEISPFCRKVLAKHWPDVRRYNDVRECGKYNLAPVDFIAGGFPCQGISKCNKDGQGLQDSRSGLWYEYQRIIAEMRPRWVLIENVRNIFNRGFENVLAGLWEIGYDAEWSIVPACVFGAAHTRERMFIVAYPNGKRWYARDQDQKGLVETHCVPQINRKKCHSTGGFDGAGIFTRNGGQSGDCQDGFGQIDEFPPWPYIEPRMDRTVDGVSGGVDRLRALGNAVVPQIAEWIGRCILKAELHI